MILTLTYWQLPDFVGLFCWFNLALGTGSSLLDLDQPPAYSPPGTQQPFVPDDEMLSLGILYNLTFSFYPPHTVFSMLYTFREVLLILY